jgi:hypothetical protein
MGIFKTYSKSQTGIPDVYTYDKVDLKLRNQIYHIWNDFFNQHCFDALVNSARREIYKTICKEIGQKALFSRGFFGSEDDFVEQVEKYFEELRDDDIHKILDAIQITFFYMELLEKLTKDENPYVQISYAVEQAIKDLNYRFRENGVGYEYSNGKIIRIDNKLLHRETIKPTLLLLTEKKFKNANDEFLKAHDHYKHKRNKECLNECLKSFESTIKIICTENKWTYNQTDTAKALINILLTNKFLPNYNESSLNALKQLLEGTVPTVRNKNSAHGAGETTIVVPDYLANYMLYITGATIRLLVDTQNERKK